MSEERSALVLFSGGIDSTTLLYYVMRGLDYRKVEAVLFDYGQNHKVELECAQEILTCLNHCAGMVIPHKIINIDLKQFGRSSLTSDDETLSMVVPARNAIFLSYAVAVAEIRKLQDIFIGATLDDFKDFPDCRPLFIPQMSLALSIGYDIGGVFAPFVYKTKKEIVELGKKLGVSYNKTWSCYNPTEENKPCNKCRACIERSKVL